MKPANRSVSQSASSKSSPRKSPPPKQPVSASSKPGTPNNDRVAGTRANARAQPKSNTKSVKTQTTSASPSITLVEAHINVGFGNALYIRGQGSGLSWEKGLPLVCVNDSTWTWTTDQVTEKVQFKLLLNDQIWAQGEDLNVGPGQKVETEPVF